MSADADTAWYEQIGLAEDIEPRVVQPEVFCRVRAVDDGLRFETTQGYIESDTVAEVVR